MAASLIILLAHTRTKSSKVEPLDTGPLNEETSQELRMLSPSLFIQGHNVIVNIVVLNCQKCNQCLKCQVSGLESLESLCSLNVIVFGFSENLKFSENLNIFSKI